MYSATRTVLVPGRLDALFFVRRQILSAVLGLVLMTAALLSDYRVLGRYSRAIYATSIGLLVIVLLFGKTISGTQGWLVIGPIRLQPAELAKVAIIVGLAGHLEKKEDMSRFRSLGTAFLLVGAPMALILLQPDFGTAMVFAGILLGMLFVSGASVRHLLAVFGAGISVIAAALYLSRAGILPILKGYQVDRFLVFLDPYAYRMGAGWNVVQSMIAIGSGRFFGKGLFAGSQTQLNFLPSRHTDFIFSVVGEEFGFLGAVAILSANFLVLLRGIKILSGAKDIFGALLAAGVVSMMTFHIVINVGMTLGMMPVTGIPLPFVSFGGSALTSNLIAIGILLSVGMRRQKIMF